jgi:hypothetical protein
LGSEIDGKTRVQGLRRTPGWSGNGLVLPAAPLPARRQRSGDSETTPMIGQPKKRKPPRSVVIQDPCREHGCKEPVVTPKCERFCRKHSPRTQTLTPYESHVANEVEKGRDPAAFVATHEGCTVHSAEQKIKRMIQDSPALRSHINGALEAAGINDSFVATKLRENLEAWKEGAAPGDEIPDFRARNTALDMTLKLRGDYPPKQTRTSIEERKVIVHEVQMPVADATIPADMPVARIKAPAHE